METKTCITCGLEKGIDQFPLEGARGQFRRNKCRACVRKWNALPKEERDRIKEAERATIRSRVEKTCPCCGLTKSREEFYASARALDGMTVYCRACDDHRTKDRGRANYMTNMREETGATVMQCRTCNEAKNIINFTKNRHNKSGYDSQCKQCKSDEWKGRVTHEKRILYLHQRIKSKCEKNDIPFDLELSDIVIPTHCPVLGIPLRFGASDKGYRNNADEASPSVDRIDSTKGYTKDNIIVVSWRANRIKGNATIEELRMIADYYQQFAK